MNDLDWLLTLDQAALSHDHQIQNYVLHSNLPSGKWTHKNSVPSTQKVNSNKPEHLPYECTQVSSGDLTKEGVTVGAGRISSLVGSRLSSAPCCVEAGAHGGHTM